MNDEESLARRICFEVGGFDPDELTANDVPRWRRYGEVVRAALDWMRERSARQVCLQPANLLALGYVEEFEGATTLDTILMDFGMNEGRREDFARWLIETVTQSNGTAQDVGG